MAGGRVRGSGLEHLGGERRFEPVLDVLLSRLHVRREVTRRQGPASCLCVLSIAVDAEREVGDRQEGRIQFRGPSATKGYLRNPEATSSLHAGHWLESGDLGYIVAGELYVTGRSKDMIIRAGRNLYPDELENAVGDLDDVRKGRVAVFASPDPRAGTERLIVLAECRQRDPAKREHLREAVVALASDLMDSPPDEVVLAPPGTVVKTPNGKVRRSACRQLYESGRLERYKHYLSICNSVPSERLGLIALKARGPILKRNRDLANANVQTLGAFFAEFAGLFEWATPDGGCIGFPRYLGADGVEAFCTRLVEEAGVFLAPASIYRSELGETPTDRFRIGYGRAKIEDGLDAMRAWILRNIS